MRRSNLSRAAWRKSSFSNGSGGSCVEAGTVWPRSADNDKPAGSEITAIIGSRDAAEHAIAIRHSKDPEGPKLVFTPAEWEAFTAGVRAGEFDLT